MDTHSNEPMTDFELLQLNANIDRGSYQYSRCSSCPQIWQNIDYGCAAHQITCGYPLPPKVTGGLR